MAQGGSAATEAAVPGASGAGAAAAGVVVGERPGVGSALRQGPQRSEPTAALAERIEAAIAPSQAYLLSLQQPDGHWCAELEGDTILESEYALTLYFLERRVSPKLLSLASYLRARQNEDGGWSNFPGGPAEVSVSTKAYFVLKLAGDDPEATHMRRAREVIRGLGGLHATNSYTRLLLSVFGVYSWEDAPAVPPELILLPRWFPINIYEMSSWSRAIVVPLSIIWALKPHCPVPEAARLDDLRVESVAAPLTQRGRNWRERAFRRFFIAVDRMLKEIEAADIRPLRELALRRAERWVEARLVKSGGLGAIFPSIMNTIMAFVCRGRAVDHPAVVAQLRELEQLELRDGDELRIQPCFSPVWDTALTMNALVESGLDGGHPAIADGARWLLDKEVKEAGDWKVKNADVAPGGWFFEYANEFYPDCDDTAEVITVLSKVRLAADDQERCRAALSRAVAWQLDMQSRNGGWGAFDKDCDRRILELVPFADHNAMLDPATVDVSARTVEALVQSGMAADHPKLRAAVAFLYSEQEQEGSWYGRWGANHIYGTWLALCGLRAAGEDMRAEPVARAVRWLLANQNDDGGWGESLWSYHDPSYRGRGATTASQTAWSLMGLLAADGLEEEASAAAIRRGVEWLLHHQKDDGSWYDEFWTGTGFPKVFYLKYHLYACYFPLQALATCRKALATSKAGSRDVQPA